MAEQSKDYEEAKRRFSEFAALLQLKFEPIKIANIFTGATIAVLRKAGGSELTEAYFSEILDDIRLDASGYLDSQDEIH